MFHGPGPGRPKGLQNKQTREQKEFAQRVLYGQSLSAEGKREFEQWVRAKFYAGLLPDSVMKLIFFYLLGKPVEHVELNVNESAELAGLSKEDLKQRARELYLEAERIADASKNVHSKENGADSVM